MISQQWAQITHLGNGGFYVRVNARPPGSLVDHQLRNEMAALLVALVEWQEEL